MEKWNKITNSNIPLYHCLVSFDPLSGLKGSSLLLFVHSFFIRESVASLSNIPTFHFSSILLYYCLAITCQLPDSHLTIEYSWTGTLSG